MISIKVFIKEKCPSCIEQYGRLLELFSDTKLCKKYQLNVSAFKCDNPKFPDGDKEAKINNINNLPALIIAGQTFTGELPSNEEIMEMIKKEAK